VYDVTAVAGDCRRAHKTRHLQPYDHYDAGWPVVWKTWKMEQTGQLKH